MINRRRFTAMWCAGFAGVRLQAADSSDPWSSAEIMQPSTLAKAISQGGQRQTIVCVAFPVLFRQRHISGAIYAGPGNKPEGIEALQTAVAKLAKDSEVVLYCGCCPMVNCPNIRPSYRALKEHGFRNIRVLDIPTNFLTDWTSKGFPVEPAKPASA